MNALGAQNIGTKGLDNGVDRDHGGTNPIGKHRLIDVDTLAPVSLALAIEMR